MPSLAHVDASRAAIPITRPWLDAEEERAILEPLRSGWVVQGPSVRAFEEAIAGYTRSEHAVATSSCTGALHLALLACGVGPGDEVPLPSFTFIATANVVERAGATPVFVDIDLDTFNADPAALAAAITPRTKALIPVHLFGLCMEMAPVIAAARRAGTVVIEDAACALGAQIRGRHAGTFGDIGCLSFHARKVLTTGEGGMALTADAGIAGRLRALREHGAMIDDFKRHAAGQAALPDYPMSGLNYRMTDLQAAIGLSQARTKLEAALARRAALAARYTERLQAIEWLRAPTVPEGFTHAFQSYVCLYQPVKPITAHANELQRRRQELMRRLGARGIATRQGTHAIHLAAYYARTYGLRPEQAPNAWLADHATLSLPLYPQMTEEEQDRVIEALGSVGP